MERIDLYRAFANRFHAGKRIRPASEAQIADAEQALGVLLPESYRQFAMTCGAVYAPNLLDLVVDNKCDFAEVQDFLTPKKSVTETRDWKLEPEGGCMAFANDSGGSYFAFRQLPSSGPRMDDATVWLFDHDADEIVAEAKSFDEWIRRFLTL